MCGHPTWSYSPARVTGATVGALDTATGTVGSTTRGLGQALGQIQITQSANVSADGGSTLSLTGGDLRLEKGTAFHLSVNESSSVNKQ